MRELKVGDFDPEEPIGDVVYRFLAEEIITERNTDTILDVVAAYVPWGLGIFVRGVLDHLLPEKALAAITELFDRLGIISNERQRHPGNPFRDHPWKEEG